MLKNISFSISTSFERFLLQKFIIQTFPFFLIWTILSSKVHLFAINSCLSFIESYASFEYFWKISPIFIIRGDEKLNQGTFFLWFFNGYSMIYANAGDLKDPLKQDLAHEFCWNKNKDFSILNKPYINHDQINHIRNNWLGNNFSLLADSHTKDLLFLLHPGLESVTEVDTDPKQRFVSFNPLQDWGGIPIPVFPL